MPFVFSIEKLIQGRALLLFLRFILSLFHILPRQTYLLSLFFSFYNLSSSSNFPLTCNSSLVFFLICTFSHSVSFLVDSKKVIVADNHHLSIEKTPIRKKRDIRKHVSRYMIRDCWKTGICEAKKTMMNYARNGGKSLFRIDRNKHHVRKTMRYSSFWGSLWTEKGWEN